VSGVLTEAKETISNVASQAGDKVTSGLDKQRTRAAEGIGSIAQALRQTSDQLRQQDQQAPTHQYVSTAADQVERFSNYLRQTDVSQMVSGIEQFARRQPALFLGSAFVLGLLGARFLKSSSGPNSGGMPGDGNRSRDDYRYAGNFDYGRDSSGTAGLSNTGFNESPGSMPMQGGMSTPSGTTQGGTSQGFGTSQGGGTSQGVGTSQGGGTSQGVGTLQGGGPSQGRGTSQGGGTTQSGTSPGGMTQPGTSQAGTSRSGSST